MAITRYAGDRFFGSDGDIKPSGLLDGAIYKCYDTFNEYLLLSGQWILSNPPASGGASGYSGYSGYSGLSGYSGYSGVSGYSGSSGASGYSGMDGDGPIFYANQNVSSDISSANALVRNKTFGGGASTVYDIVSGSTSYISCVTYPNVPGVSILPPGSWRFSFFGRIFTNQNTSVQITPTIGITNGPTVSSLANTTGLFTGTPFIVTGSSNIRTLTYYEQTGNIYINPNNRLVLTFIANNIYPTGVSGLAQVLISTPSGTFFEGTVYKGLQESGSFNITSANLLAHLSQYLSGVAIYDNVPTLRSETLYQQKGAFLTKGSGVPYDAYGHLYFFEPSVTSTDDGVNIIKPDNIGGGSPGRYQLWI